MSHNHHEAVRCDTMCPEWKAPSKRGTYDYMAVPEPDFAAVSKERKETPIWSGCLRYFPNALAAIARHSRMANEKHNPGEPLHWARAKSRDHFDCAVRHLATPDEVDPEFGDTHLVAAAWRVLAALQEQEEKRLGRRPSWHTDD